MPKVKFTNSKGLHQESGTESFDLQGDGVLFGQRNKISGSLNLGATLSLNDSGKTFMIGSGSAGAFTIEYPVTHTGWNAKFVVGQDAVVSKGGARTGLGAAVTLSGSDSGGGHVVTGSFIITGTDAAPVGIVQGNGSNVGKMIFAAGGLAAGARAGDYVEIEVLRGTKDTSDGFMAVVHGHGYCKN